MQGLAQLDSRSQFIQQSGKTIDVPPVSGNLYTSLLQEVDLGVQALSSGSADTLQQRSNWTEADQVLMIGKRNRYAA